MIRMKDAWEESDQNKLYHFKDFVRFECLDPSFLCIENTITWPTCWKTTPFSSFLNFVLHIICYGISHRYVSSYLKSHKPNHRLQDSVEIEYFAQSFLIIFLNFIMCILIIFEFCYFQASAADDIYWEGEDDLANEFLEVDRDAGIGGHLRRLKRGFLGKFTIIKLSSTVLLWDLKSL